MSNNRSVTLFQDEANQAVPQVSTKFHALMNSGVGTDLGEGIRNSFAIVSIKGGRFRLKYKGNEQMLLDYSNPSYPAPIPFIDVVIVKANPFLNKQFYKGQFVEGSNSPPDCFSLDGKVPSPSVQRPEHNVCALCPQNQFGSKITEEGKKQKACRDTKKLAVVPLVDLRNQAMGGAMLFRVPPSGLKDLSVMADALKARGYPYNGIAVRIGFDMTVSHPKPTFQALRPLSDGEADVVIEMFSSDSVAAVLADNDDIVLPPEDEAPIPASAQFIQPTPVASPATAQAAAQPRPAPRPQAPAPTPPPAARPAPAQPQAVPQAAPNPFSAQPQVAVGQVAIQPFRPGVPASAPPATAFTAPVGQAQPTTLQLAPEDIGELELDPATEIINRHLPQAAQPAAPVNPFAPPPGAAVQQQPAAAPRQRRKPVTPVASPATVAAPAEVEQPETMPSGGALQEDIDNILSGLGSYGSK